MVFSAIRIKKNLTNSISILRDLEVKETPYDEIFMVFCLVKNEIVHNNCCYQELLKWNEMICFYFGVNNIYNFFSMGSIIILFLE